MTAAGIPALLEPIQARLDAQLPDSARMDAYYYGFNRTGFGPVDAILSAVAVAGKGSHHTESWAGNESAWFYGDRPGLPSADGAEDLIQKTADLAARNITTDTARLLAAVKAVDSILSQALTMISADPDVSEYERGFDDSTRGLSAKLHSAVEAALRSEA